MDFLHFSSEISRYGNLKCYYIGQLYKLNFHYFGLQFMSNITLKLFTSYLFICIYLGQKC